MSQEIKKYQTAEMVEDEDEVSDQMEDAADVLDGSGSVSTGDVTISADP